MNNRTIFRERRKYILNLLIIVTFAFFVLSPLRTQATGGTYLVGSTIDSAITFTASENVVAADFIVDVSPKEALVSVTCGGSGFTNAGPSAGTHCVLWNPPSGAKSGTIATVVVQATTVGTLTVSVSGDLATAEGQPAADGQLRGASYTIVAPTPIPTDTPIPTEVPTEIPTAVPTSPPGVPTATPLPPTPVPTARPTAVPTAVAPTVTPIPEDKVIVVDEQGGQQETTEPNITVTKEHVKVIFPETSLQQASKSITITEDNEKGIVLEFGTRLQKEGVESKIVLTKELQIEKKYKDSQGKIRKIVIIFPEGLTISALDDKTQDFSWDGLFQSIKILPTSAVTIKNGIVKLVVEVGLENQPLLFDKPVKLILSGQSGLSAGYSVSNQTKEITRNCPTKQKFINEFLKMFFEECFAYEDKDLIIQTKHFTKFFTFEKLGVTPTGPQPTPIQPPTPGLGKVVIIVTLVILVAGGGGVFYYLRFVKKPKEGLPTEEMTGEGDTEEGLETESPEE